MERGITSSGHNWERLAKAGAPSTKTRIQATPNVDTVWSRRLTTPVTYNLGDSSEQEDIVQMLVDPNSNIARAQGNAFKRWYDNKILAAAVGTTQNVDAAGAVTTSALPAGQIVNTGAATSLTFDMITAVSEKFLANDIDPDEEKVWVLGPTQARKLMQLTEATSGDYNSVRPLQDTGVIRNWMGFTWVISNQLPLGSTGAGSLWNVVMTRRAMGMMVERDISTKVAEDPTTSFMWRIYTYATFGVGRIEDEHIVGVDLLNSL
jgi:hypothetical protein